MSTSRRDFLAAPVILQAAQHAPSDRIRIGLIGAGGRARDHQMEIRRSGENVQIAAVCDVWKVNLEATAARVEKDYGARPFTCTKYQDLLARKDIDAVTIATPDFTHPKILIDAVAAGKDVYVEKPFAVEFDEGKAAYLAVKKSDRIVQVGTQRRSDPGLMGAAKAIQSGAIGKVTRIETHVNFQEPRWRRDHHMIKAEDVDWEAFSFNGRVKGGFNARKFREWQLFRETTNGIAGLWMCHFIDLVPWFLRDPYPKSAVTQGGVYLWKDGRQTSDVFHSLIEYNDCLVSFEMSLTNASGNRNVWYGTLGTLDADKLVMTPEGSRDPNRLTEAKPVERVQTDSHMANFLKCVRSRQQPRATVEAGFSHAVPVCMASIALDEGRRVTFNREKLELS